MANQYFVSHNNEQQGPYTVEQIVSHVKDGELVPVDYIYDEDKGDWVMLMDFHELAPKLEALKPSAPPKPKKQEKAKAKAEPANNFEHEWYVLKGENKFGPFAYPDVIKMLQQGVVYEFDFAWHNGMENWQRIAELEAFSHENVKKLKDTLMPEISEVFFRRRHRRAKYGATVLIHDNKKLWKGEGVEISAGGAGVVMENSMVVPGQKLYLHFKPGDGVPPFNAICEVVSKRYEEGVKSQSESVRYGVKFLTISSEAKKFLQDYTKKAAAAA
jgi:c-di-GMP-binding flagellar brake protein YcgR